MLEHKATFWKTYLVRHLLIYHALRESVIIFYVSKVQRRIKTDTFLVAGVYQYFGTFWPFFWDTNDNIVYIEPSLKYLSQSFWKMQCNINKRTCVLKKSSVIWTKLLNFNTAWVLLHFGKLHCSMDISFHDIKTKLTCTNNYSWPLKNLVSVISCNKRAVALADAVICTFSYFFLFSFLFFVSIMINSLLWGMWSALQDGLMSCCVNRGKVHSPY